MRPPSSLQDAGPTALDVSIPSECYVFHIIMWILEYFLTKTISPHPHPHAHTHSPWMSEITRLPLVVRPHSPDESTVVEPEFLLHPVGPERAVLVVGTRLR